MKTARLHRFARALLCALSLAAGSVVAADNRSDIWWNPAEAGRGLIVIDHETDLYVFWCTYLPSGAPTWYVMPGGKLSADRRTFQGNLYQTSTVGYGEVIANSVIQVGMASVDFSPEGLAPGWARFSISAGSGTAATVETHDVTRQPFGSGAPVWGTDATDLWYDPEDSGWGVATIQHGSADIFAVVLTYDYYGTPVFFVVPSRFDSSASSIAPLADQFDGDAYATSTSGTHEAFDPSDVRVRRAGIASMRFLKEPPLGLSRMSFNTDVSFVPQPSLFRLQFGRAMPSAAKDAP